jgi:hypothetical protein
MTSNSNEGMEDDGSASNSLHPDVEDDSERSSRSLGGGGESITSVTSGYASTTQGGGRKVPDHIVAKEESRAVALSRIFVLLVLCASASVAGVTTYVLSLKAETAGFRLQVRSC